MRTRKAFVLCLLALWNERSSPIGSVFRLRLCEAKAPHVLPLRRPEVETRTIAPVKIRGGGEAAWKSGVKNSLASALAAASSKLLLAPLDTIKTLQQSQRATGQASLSVVQAARAILQRPKGFLELYVRTTCTTKTPQTPAE